MIVTVFLLFSGEGLDGERLVYFVSCRAFSMCDRLIN